MIQVKIIFIYVAMVDIIGRILILPTRMFFRLVVQLIQQEHYKLSVLPMG